MKGYVKNKVLYIFPQTADTIPYVDPSVEAIAVQEENIAAWKKENAEYADIIVKYNYNTITVNPKVWAGHTNDDIVVPTPPAPTTYDIYLSEGGANYVDVPESAEAGETVTITMASGEEDKFDYITLTSSEVEITKGATTWTFTMPAEDVTITATYNPPYDITLTGDNTEYLNAPASATEDATVTIITLSEYDDKFAYIELESSEVEITKGMDAWSFTMPAEDVTITVTYNPPLFTITYTGDTEYVDNSYTEAAEADEVTIYPASDYEQYFSNVTLASSETEITKGADTWSFTMPAEDVTITVTYTP